MICKNCGTDIAARAIVCYRCGQATVEAQRKPAALPSRGRSLIVTLSFVVLLFAALFLGQAGTDLVPQVVSWALAAVAAIIAAWRIVVRRR